MKIFEKQYEIKINYPVVGDLVVPKNLYKNDIEKTFKEIPKIKEISKSWDGEDNYLICQECSFKANEVYVIKEVETKPIVSESCSNMKRLFVTQSTEYDFGQRPDGYFVATDLKVLQRFIKEKGNSGSSECFWRCSEPFEIFMVDNEDYQFLETCINDGLHNVNAYCVYHIKELLKNMFKQC